MTGVVVHLSDSRRPNSPNYGHYVAYVRSVNDTLWQSISDNDVATVTSEHVLKQQAYILLYTCASELSQAQPAATAEVQRALPLPADDLVQHDSTAEQVM